MVATIALVLGFHRATALAAAYGIAVTTTMVITDVLVAVAMRHLFRWSYVAVALLTAVFLAADVSYFAGNIVKIAEGGWFPLSVGIGVFIIMTTWRRGTAAAPRADQRGVAAARRLQGDGGARSSEPRPGRVRVHDRQPTVRRRWR